MNEEKSQWKYSIQFTCALSILLGHFNKVVTLTCHTLDLYDLYHKTDKLTAN